MRPTAKEAPTKRPVRGSATCARTTRCAAVRCPTGGGTIYNNGTNQFQNLSGLTGSSAFLNWLWLNAYTGIGRANTALRTIDTFEGLAPRQKEILQGEACFNRAWFYFVVLKLWGKGPIVPLETLSGAEQAALKISDRTALYDTIVADLQIALKMPDKAESAKWYPTSWYGRAHKGSAQGLLAKVLLYRAADDPANAMQYYQQIVQIVKDMESSTDGYDLIAVDNIFTKAGEYSVESVFEIGAASFTTSDGAYQGWQLLGTRGEPNWGWGYIAPSLNLVQSYEPGDKRKDNDIIYGKTTIYSGMVQTQKRDRRHDNHRAPTAKATRTRSATATEPLLPQRLPAAAGRRG